MNLGIKMYYLLLIGAIIILFQLDFIKRNIILESQIEVNDSVTQDVLAEYIKVAEKEGYTITEEALIHNWLLHFSRNNNITIDHLEVRFDLVSSDPPVMMVSIGGYDDYLIINGNNEYLYQTNVFIEAEKK